MVIRPIASDAEAEQCAAMMAASEPWISYGRTYERCLKIVRDPGSELHIAVEEGHVRGFIIIVMHGAFVGYIKILCVDPALRSKGIGSRLVAFAEERIFSESPNVFLCVSDFNTRARALYERLGYEKIGELRDYLAKGFTEVLMRKTRGPIG